MLQVNNPHWRRHGCLPVLLLYFGAKDCKDLYIRSDKYKEKQNVYNFKVLKQLLGDDVCSDMLFAHLFSGCDTIKNVWCRQD